MIKCKVCNGRKNLLGMGSMPEKCKTCKGKGFTPETDKLNAPASVVHSDKKERNKMHDGKA